MDSDIKKKRGRKPKNFTFEQPLIQSEKKKRGRKKKYEIENFEKILHRDSVDNFNHNVIYSDDDHIEEQHDTTNSVKKISFGNLDITVSKKICVEDPNDFKLKTRSANVILINKDEYSSDEDTFVPVESFVNQKVYSENKKYTTKAVSECNPTESLKRIKVITTTKEQIKEPSEWPETCNSCCWWCCHTFECSPCTLPMKYDSLRKRFTFVGLFCSWNCVKAYNLDKSDHCKFERSGIITLLIQQLHGITKAVNIKPAPPRQCLKMFGGYMDIDDFRNPNGIDGFYLNLVNFNYIHPEITEVSNVKLKLEKKILRLSRN